MREEEERKRERGERSFHPEKKRDEAKQVERRWRNEREREREIPRIESQLL